MTIHDLTVQPKPIEPGDLVEVYFEKKLMCLARAVDIYTGRAYVVGTLPALTFQMNDGSMSEPIPYFRGEDELPYWRYLAAADTTPKTPRWRGPFVTDETVITATCALCCEQWTDTGSIEAKCPKCGADCSHIEFSYLSDGDKAVVPAERAPRVKRRVKRRK